MNREKLSAQDVELVKKAVETADRLYLKDAHTQAGLVFSGIHIEANVGFADVCGKVAAICHAVAHGQRDMAAIVAAYKGQRGTARDPAAVWPLSLSNQRFQPALLGDPFKVDVSDLLPLKC